MSKMRLRLSKIKKI